MPPAILNDSEDEGDAVLYDDPKEDSLSRSSGADVGNPALNGTRATNGQSTGSTERLKRQINVAQWDLCGDSSEQPPLNHSKLVQAAAGSPTLPRNTRRHSSARDSDVEPAANTVKRARTTATYSAKKPTSSSLQREQFLAGFGQDATAPNTSPSIRFSDHPGARGSSDLPAGSIQTAFINHEPAMFKESGSTVPDNESSHERMLEQALRSKKHSLSPSSPSITLVEPDELHRSSSFPWPASEQTGSSENQRAQNISVPIGEPSAQEQLSGSQPHGTMESRHKQHDKQHTAPPPVLDEPVVPSPATAVMVPQIDQSAVKRSSPTLYIDAGGEHISVLPESVAAPIEIPQKPGRGRKRKVQEDSSEPLTSDETAVGLPKERYKSRPSRRRTTQIDEEPIDYSVIPEKVAKIKRSKTMGGEIKAPDNVLQAANKQPSPLVHREPEPSDAQHATNNATTLAKTLDDDENANGMADVIFKPSPVVEVPAAGETQPSQAKHEGFETKTTSASQASNETSNHDDTVFVKPAPKPKTSSKSRRSSTTIFEDHVDFTRKSRSPSLNQQQAMRQSALRDVKNEASPPRHWRGGKPVIHDDDDEDELAMDPMSQDEKPDELPDEPPKKRGRGRPPKSASKSNAKSTAKSSQKVDAGPHGGEDADEIAIQQPPKKRRGRPPKSAVSEPTIDDKKASSDVNEKHHKPVDEELVPDKSIEETIEQGTPEKQNSVKEIPTPSPEKQPSAEISVGLEKQAKSNSITNSPIKSKSPAPYRVGLSKKHRIPSLLRVMRPPPPPPPPKRG